MCNDPASGSSDVDLDRLGTPAGGGLPQQCLGEAAGGVRDPPPRDIGAVAGEDPADHPWPRSDEGRHVTVGHHAARRHAVHRHEDAFDDVVAQT
jgi:hypothetical protein